MTTRKKWIIEEGNKKRCWWCGSDPLYMKYHDNEWGRPVKNDNKLFEKICLEGFQAGLSWLTILRKRENFRKAFKNFDIIKVARMTGRDVNRLLKNEGIVRHRGKIESTINNAKRAMEIQNQFGTLASFLWQFAPEVTRLRKHKTGRTMPAKTDYSTTLSKDLRKQGWSFVGQTTMYAFMQSIGMVNDHLEGCDAFLKVKAARERFRVPELSIIYA